MRERLFASLEDFGDAVALIGADGTALSYDALARMADAAALPLGTRRRLVAVELENAPEPIAFYIGALRAGHVVIPHGGGDAAERIADAFAPDASFARHDGGWSLADESRHAVELHPELAVLLSTSGSTGSPKLVRLSHANLLSNARSIAEYLALQPGERAITSLPSHYSYGLSVLHAHLLFGHALVLTEHSIADRGFWETIDREGVTSIAGVPHSYELMLRGGLHTAPHPSLRYVTQAGGRLPAERVREVAGWAAGAGIRFYVMYGQTEAAPRMAYLPPADVARHAASIGRAIPGGSFRLDPVDGESELPPGAGELVYRGPNVMMGYALSPADLALPQGPDTLRTGDIAVRDPSGYFRVVGRMNRFAKLFGLRLSFDDIEQRLAAAGVDAAVSGDDDGIVVATTMSGAAAWIPEQLGRDLGIPAALVFATEVDAIPRFATGKVDYGALRALRRAPPERAARSLTEAMTRILGRQEIDPRASFAALGGDSLTYIQAGLAVEDHLGHMPPDWESTPIQVLERMPRRASETPGSAGARPLLSILGFDVARSAAMAIALFSHCLFQANVTVPIYGALILRTSTPTLILLFGVMIALLQTPRAANEGSLQSIQKNLAKAIECYSLFALNVVVIWLLRPSEWLGAVLSLAMLGGMQFAQLLGFYAIMFLLVPLLIPVLRRHFWWLFLASFAVHLAFVPLKNVPEIPSIQRLLDQLVGTSDAPHVPGPSVLHSLVLVLAGYYLGLAAKRSAADANPPRAFLYRQLPLIGLFAVAGVASLWIPGYPVTRVDLVSMKLRMLNHPAYIFMIGGASLLLLQLLLLTPLTRRTPHSLLAIGHRSLFAFGFGNALILLVPKGAIVGLPPLLNAMLIFAAVVALIYLYDYCMRVGKHGRGLPRLVFLATSGAQRAIDRFATELVRPLAGARKARPAHA